MKFVLTACTIKAGAYLEVCQIKVEMPYATDLEIAKRLWRAGEEIVGECFNI
jgi:hypothetical protein